MRILAVIPHYDSSKATSSPDGRWHGSVAQATEVRVAAVSACIAALHQLYGSSQYIVGPATRVASPANQRTAGRVAIVVCTTGEDHLIGRLPVPDGSFTHHPTGRPPPLLGFECHAVLRDRLGGYDYYAFLEDDLIARDPRMFVKLGWFTGQLGDGVLLHPPARDAG